MAHWYHLPTSRKCNYANLGIIWLSNCLSSLTSLLLYYQPSPSGPVQFYILFSINFWFSVWFVLIWFLSIALCTLPLTNISKVHFLNKSPKSKLFYKFINSLLSRFTWTTKGIFYIFLFWFVVYLFFKGNMFITAQQI